MKSDCKVRWLIFKYQMIRNHSSECISVPSKKRIWWLSALSSELIYPMLVQILVSSLGILIVQHNFSKCFICWGDQSTRKCSLGCIGTSVKNPFTSIRLYTLLYGEGNGTPLQCSYLENPTDGGSWWAAVHGVAKSRTRLSDFTFTFHFHTLEKAMAPHSITLEWKIPGTGKPGGLPTMGSHSVGHDWSNLAAAAAADFFKYLCSGVPVWEHNLIISFEKPYNRSHFRIHSASIALSYCSPLFSRACATA